MRENIKNICKSLFRGNSIITLSEDVQNLDPLTPCLPYLFNFDSPLSPSNIHSNSWLAQSGYNELKNLPKFSYQKGLFKLAQSLQKDQIYFAKTKRLLYWSK